MEGSLEQVSMHAWHIADEKSVFAKYEVGVRTA